MQQAIPIYADEASLADIRHRFRYVYHEAAELPGRLLLPADPDVAARRLRGPFVAAGIPIVPFAQDHGFSTTLGFRVGSFAYSTDVTELDDAAFATLEGIEVWIVDCLRREPHPTAQPSGEDAGQMDRATCGRGVAAVDAYGPEL